MSNRSMMAKGHTAGQAAGPGSKSRGQEPAYVLWFDALTRKDVPIAGGKGANLGEMTRAGLPVPRGFVITAAAFQKGIEPVQSQVSEIWKRIDPDNLESLAAHSKQLKELIRGLTLPEELRKPLLDAYHQLGAGRAVAVRSSATSEDTATTSFAGMHESFTNVVGDDVLLEKLLACWCSAYGERVVAYRKSQGLTEEPSIAVVVQEMVDSARSGVMFTADPATGDTGRLVIEGAFGLGEVVVGGQVEPDTYTVLKQGPRLLEVRVGHKDFKLIREGTGQQRRVTLNEDEAKQRVLRDEEVLEMARLGLRVEQHYGSPQDAEWAEEGGRFYLVQTRPITTPAEAARHDKGGEGQGARHRPGSLAGYRLRPGAGAAQARGGPATAEGGDPRHGDDVAGLGAHHCGARSPSSPTAVA